MKRNVHDQYQDGHDSLKFQLENAGSDQKNIAAWYVNFIRDSETQDIEFEN